ncbi:MAG TPA: OsmC family protein [Methylomirabilota bacterium]|nr:OsmC family protein [Methylomirabilota bacterium]
MNAHASAAADAPVAKAPPAPRNGVDTPTLFATINVVAGQPELAKFQFRARNAWQWGTHSRSEIGGFYGAGGEHERPAVHIAEGDHPTVLTGADRGPTPVEFLLHALAACITAGIANIAAARGVKLRKVSSFVEGDIDLRGILGLSDQVRNGFDAVRIRFEIDGDAPPEKLREIVQQSRARSAVFDVLSNGIPVSVDVSTEAQA